MKEVNMDKYIFARTLHELLSDIVQDANNPGHIPKYRVKSEVKAVRALAKAAGIEDLSDMEVHEILGG